MLKNVRLKFPENSIEIISFLLHSDASGLAAAIFVRVECENSVRLLSAKSRITPQKTTIPRRINGGHDSC